MPLLGRHKTRKRIEGVTGPRIQGMAHGLGLKVHGEKPYALRPSAVRHLNS